MRHPIRLLLALLVLLPGAAVAAGGTPVTWTVGPAAKGGGGGRVLLGASKVFAAICHDPASLPALTKKVQADAEGKVSDPLLQNGWAARTVETDHERTVILSGRGFLSVFVNGEVHTGDPYRDGFVRYPIHLAAGKNRILVRAFRGSFTLKLEPAVGPCSLAPHDSLLPDFRADTLIDEPGAVVVLNHTGKLLQDAVLEIGDDSVVAHTLATVPAVLPYGVAKPSFPVRQLRAPHADELDAKGRYLLPVVLRCGSAAYSGVYPIDVRKAGDPYRETRISNIDGSVQYMAVRPPVKVVPGRRYALFLSLHGAGVQAIGQARAYTAKRDAFVIAPTNRRRFGFDWQDEGRLDALEALAYAKAHYPIAPDRIYLTGHSMGGHGTWYLGSLFASRFAAIAPSAGWSSFFTYGGLMSRHLGLDPNLRPFELAQEVNDTDAFLGNLAMTPVYVLHGALDDNVPLTESKHLFKELKKYQPDSRFHIQPGVKHWWGPRCVDWNPLFEFCRHHIRVEAPLSVRFVTPNPAIVDRAAWVRVTAATKQGALTGADADADPRTKSVEVTTRNAAGLVLDVGKVIAAPTAEVTVDGTLFSAKTSSPLRLVRGRDGLWARGTPPVKGGGPFKLVFANRMAIVYGTSGTPEENEAILAKVRHDAETWWVRGNGTMTVVPDRDYEPTRFAGRNVILYGNADTNSAYEKLLPHCPIRIARKSIRIGDRVLKDDLALLMVYPKPDGDKGFVGVIGGTSVLATKLLDTARYFVSGVGCPDYAVFSTDTLSQGMEGVAAAGYFTNTWKLPH